MHGYGADDNLQGDKGSDHLYGDAGSDHFLWAGAYDAATNTYPWTRATTMSMVVAGTTTISGGHAQGGVDRIYGEGGNDFISASQREIANPAIQVTKEIIDCGAGASDEVWFDKGLDVVTNCEIKQPYYRSRA